MIDASDSSNRARGADNASGSLEDVDEAVRQQSRSDLRNNNTSLSPLCCVWFPRSGLAMSGDQVTDVVPQQEQGGPEGC